MPRLDDVPLEALRAELDTVDDRRPVLRLLAAILYKQGPSVPTIAEWFDVRPATVYAWFDRLEAAESLGPAVRDAPRPGRPPRLSAEEREELFSVLDEPPSNAGYGPENWTPRLVRRIVRDRFDVTYSLRHARRLLTEAREG